MAQKCVGRTAKLVRIGASVEGSTEERFIIKVIHPFLITKNIDITPINLGGNVSLDKIKSELQKIAYGFDYVTTFYDFYGFKGKEDNETKVSLEQKIMDKAHDNIKRKLFPYVQMYEFEALLFSDPNAIQQITKIDEISIWANAVLSRFTNNPEAINDSVLTAPSKRIAKKFDYIKTTHGPDIAEAIGLEKIREMCHGFNEWLTKLENISEG